MAIRPLLYFPDPKLCSHSTVVETVDTEVCILIDDMLETMYAAVGIGLAAAQIGVFKRVFVMDLSENGNAPLVFVNPELIDSQGHEKSEEGCLSVPGVYESVERAQWVKVRALGRNGEIFEMEASGLMAVCIQHETDHLDGKLFVDYLSSLKRRRIRKKIEKTARQKM